MDGSSVREIAAVLHLSSGTVRNDLSSPICKVGQQPDARQPGPRTRTTGPDVDGVGRPGPLRLKRSTPRQAEA
ncbi:sigma-70 region 4 domain-containing protein [Serinibacter arcticus]|uniref:sigma-70 region 4 domain-containing protein n=1 Tax=Serinibacter arcticus TaxID=1655435 RepID=UPI001F2680E5|nr:sigma-70 region 4 domain-containing protein [Serinibacter arcticus]